MKKRRKKNPGNVYIPSEEPSGGGTYYGTAGATEWLVPVAVGVGIITLMNVAKAPTGGEQYGPAAPSPSEDPLLQLEMASEKFRTDQNLEAARIENERARIENERARAALEAAKRIQKEVRVPAPAPTQAAAPTPTRFDVSFRPPVRGGGVSTITGGGGQVLASGPTQKIHRPGFLSGPSDSGLVSQDVQNEFVSTAASAVQNLQAGSAESTKFLTETALHPESVQANVQHMSLMGKAVTAYTIYWAFGRLFG